MAQENGKNTPGSNSPLYLLDAMALAYRAHFAFISRPLINSRGQNTSAAYGFTNTLVKLIEDHGITHMAVVFDVVGPGAGTFRDELFEEYKANRSPIPEDLAEALPCIKDIVEAAGVAVIEVPGVEADDVIGTLAQQAAREGTDVVIVSPDKDFQQLLDERISMFRPARRGETFDPVTEDTFREKYGLPPIRFIDLLALMGDASDNVPGVQGIGEKTAGALIREYGSVETLLEHAEEVKGKRAREGLLAHREEALLSKQLVTIKTDVELDVTPAQLARSSPDREALLSLFNDLQFNTFFRKVKAGTFAQISGEPAQTGEEPQTTTDVPEIQKEEEAPRPTFFSGEPADGSDLASYDPQKAAYRLISDRETLQTVVEELQAADRFAFDTETTSVDPMWASLVGISFAQEAGKACYIPTPLPDGTPTADILVLLEPILRGNALKIGQNVKYDVVTLERHGMRTKGPFFDTMVAHYLLSPEEPHGLDSLALKFLRYKTIPIEDLIGTGKNQLSMRDVSPDKTCPYACEDADVTLRLADTLAVRLKEDDLLELAEQIEFPLLRVLADMEMTGIRVDPDMLAALSEEMGAHIRDLEEKIHKEAGEPFNIGSPRQLGGILFEKFNLRVVSRTSTGAPSTKEDVLETLAASHPLPALVLEWRKFSKLKSTYVDSLGKLIHPDTGRIHTNYNQTVAATGRLSSAGPNLQNIPIRTDKGKEIRKAFVAEKGWKLLSSDYVQIELRILASMSGDEALSEAFRQKKDVHRAVAAMIYDVSPEEVHEDQRRKAKEVNYGIPYGISAWGLAQRLRCQVGEAQELIDSYLKTYPAVTAHIKRVVEEARERGYVRTILGRRRFVPNINSRNRTQRSFSERVAVNMPIQGSQADMIKIAMVHIARRLKREGLATRMLLQVHDELVLEAPPEEIDAVQAIVREEMESALSLDVPIEVHMDTGDNWLDAH